MAEFLPASVLAEPGWMADRVAGTARTFGIADQRVAATLWWYSTSWVLLGPVAERLVVAGEAIDPELAAVRLEVQPDGRINAAYATRVLTTKTPAEPMAESAATSQHQWAAEAIEELAPKLRAALTAIIQTLCDISPVRHRPLWAIATDSLGNRALGASSDVAAAMASQISIRLATAIGEPMPVPRFETVKGKTSSRTFVNRTSCCLVYQIPHGQFCVSCPKLSADERRRDWTELTDR